MSVMSLHVFVHVFVIVACHLRYRRNSSGRSIKALIFITTRTTILSLKRGFIPCLVMSSTALHFLSAPFRFLQCTKPVCEEVPEPKTLSSPKPKVVPVSKPREGVQVSVLGADTAVGQYVALLLKQCPCVKK